MAKHKNHLTLADIQRLSPAAREQIMAQLSQPERDKFHKLTATPVLEPAPRSPPRPKRRLSPWLTLFLSMLFLLIVILWRLASGLTQTGPPITAQAHAGLPPPSLAMPGYSLDDVCHGTSNFDACVEQEESAFETAHELWIAMTGPEFSLARMREIQETDREYCLAAFGAKRAHAYSYLAACLTLLHTRDRKVS